MRYLSLAVFAVGVVFLSPLYAVEEGEDLDYTVINKLPERRQAAGQASEAGWNSMATRDLKGSTASYEDALVAMMADLIKAYYPEHILKPEQAQEYAGSLSTTRFFEMYAGNPSGRVWGNEESLEVMTEITDKLEAMIEQMVGEIVQERKDFDFEAWKAKWETKLNEPPKEN